jgi:hypothetical protein
MKREIRGLASAIFFALGVAFIFQSWEIALILTASLGIHELGHIIMIWRYGIEWEMGFAAIGAWTKTPLKKRQELDHFANSLIHLAGPLFSFLFAITSLILYFAIGRGPERIYWLRLANLSAVISLFNFMPLGRLSDGGKFIKRMFASLTEAEEKRLLWLILPSLITLVDLLLKLDLARGFSLLTVLLWLVISMLTEGAQDDPMEAYSPKAMTHQQAGRLLSLVIMSYLGCMVILLITPFWLTENQALNMVSGLLTLVASLIWRTSVPLKILLGIGIIAAFSRAGLSLITNFRRGVEGTNKSSRKKREGSSRTETDEIGGA